MADNNQQANRREDQIKARNLAMSRRPGSNPKTPPRRTSQPRPEGSSNASSERTKGLLLSIAQRGRRSRASKKAGTVAREQGAKWAARLISWLTGLPVLEPVIEYILKNKLVFWGLLFVVFSLIFISVSYFVIVFYIIFVAPCRTDALLGSAFLAQINLISTSGLSGLFFAQQLALCLTG